MNVEQVEFDLEMLQKAGEQYAKVTDEYIAKFKTPEERHIAENVAGGYLSSQDAVNAIAKLRGVSDE